MPNIDDPWNSDWLRHRPTRRNFDHWTTELIDAECSDAYDIYSERRRRTHRKFPNDPEVARHSVFPDGYGWIGSVVPVGAWHRAWWAAKSSQTLALTILCSAARADPSLTWLPRARTLGPR